MSPSKISTAFCLVSLSALAWGSPSRETPFPRTVLALYNSAENLKEDVNPIFKNAQLPLNHLGLKVVYYDIERGLPTEDQLKDVRGILTWFTGGKMADPKGYCHWLAGQAARGRRIVVIGELGAGRNLQDQPTDLASLNEAFGALGLRYEGNLIQDPLRLRVAYKDSTMVEFERRLEGDDLFYERWVSVDPKNKVFLQIERSDVKDSQSDVVVLSPHGGFTAPGYALYHNPNTHQSFWRINPFDFFERAFGLAGSPKPDVTTLFGRRILYTHIDGDGFANGSEVQDQTLQIGLSRSCGEVVRDFILKVYPFPATISVIEAEIDPAYLGKTGLEETARTIFRLAHVEAASHTFSHPLDWSKKIVSFAIPNYSTSLKGDLDQSLEETMYPQAAHADVTEELYLQKEIVDAARYIRDKLLPTDKAVRLVQWSGNCRPEKGAILAADQAGLRNINGGDGRFDEKRPSYTSLAPFMRTQGEAIQFFSSMANDNIFFNEAPTGYSAYRKIIQTFEQSENPTLLNNPSAGLRRVLPVNIYYHFFSAARVASFRALQEVYAWAAARTDLIPMFTSEYVDGVKGFLTAAITHAGNGIWHIRNAGSCRTIRFDREPLIPDLERSEGVVGWSRWHDHLYVHLGSPDAKIVLAKKPSVPLHVEESGAMLYQCVLSRDALSFKARAFRPEDVVLAGIVPQSAWDVVIQKAAVSMIADASGRLHVRIPGAGYYDVSIHLKH